MEMENEKSNGKLEWFVYIIFIPLVFALIFTVIILSFLNFPVKNTLLIYGNKVPGLEKILPEPKEPSLALLNPEEEIKVLDQRIKEKESKLSKFQSDIKLKEEDITKKDGEIKNLQEEVANLKKIMEENTTTEQEREKEIQDLAKLYATMSASKSAPIIEKLTLEERVQILESMKNDQRSPILAKMDPQKAAESSILLKDTKLNKDADIASLQKRIQELTKSLSEYQKSKNSISELINTYKKMPIPDAAKAIENLLIMDEEKGLKILSNMDETTRSGIMSIWVQEEKVDFLTRITNKLIN